MSKPAKQRCAECSSTLRKSANYCTSCGTRRGSLGKSFYQEPDPAIRELMWRAQTEPTLAKVAKMVNSAVFK